MLSPSVGDGSISSSSLTLASTQRGEWIELYNPNLCESIDIGCYYLGNNTNTGKGGFIIPANTVVPPAGFCIVRGVNAPAVPTNLLVANGGRTVEIIVPANTSGEGNCTTDTRIWFPNAGGWFAFYDRTGAVQDAVTWGSGNFNDRNGTPCVATRPLCNGNSVNSLMSYTDIPANRKNTVTTIEAGQHMDLSIRRGTDGGAWASYGTPTYGTCNGVCFDPNSTTCDGTATINVTGGAAPYTYLWDDSQAQVTQEAIGLCEGNYVVTVRDANGTTQTFNTNIVNFEPQIALSTSVNTLCLNANAVNLTVTPALGTGDVATFTGPGMTSNSFNPAMALEGTHTINCAYTNANGCPATANIQMIVRPLPQPTWNIQNPYCLPSNTAEDLQLSPTGGTLTGNGTVANGFNPTLAGIGNHNISYRVTNEFNCEQTIMGVATVVQSTQGQLTVADFACEYDSPITPVGNLNNATLTMNGQTINTTLDPTAFPSGEYTLIYKGTDNNGCRIEIQKPFIIRPRPALEIQIPENICSNILETNIGVTPAGGILTGDYVVGNLIIPAGMSEQNLNVHYQYVDTYGCANEIDKKYNTITAKIPELNYGTDCFFNAIMQGNFNQFSSINWNSDHIKEKVISDNHYLTYAIEGIHNVHFSAVDVNGCPSTMDLVVDVPLGLTLPDYQVPNVITPNNDNVNDVLMMSQKFTECIDYTIEIVNRWGNHVFTQTNDLLFSGKNKNGEDLPTGVYFFEVHADEVDYKDETFKPYRSGFIQIIR